MKFVVCWIRQQLYLPFQSANTSVRSRWDLRFILLSSKKAEKTRVCKRGHGFYIMRTYCICDLWPLNWLLMVINTHQVVPTYANTHINPPSRGRLTSQCHLHTWTVWGTFGRLPLNNWTAKVLDSYSTFLSCHQNELLELYCSVELAVLGCMWAILSLNSLWCLQLNQSGVPDS